MSSSKNPAPSNQVAFDFLSNISLGNSEAVEPRSPPKKHKSNSLASTTPIKKANEEDLVRLRTTRASSTTLESDQTVTRSTENVVSKRADSVGGGQKIKSTRDKTQKNMTSKAQNSAAVDFLSGISLGHDESIQNTDKKNTQVQTNHLQGVEPGSSGVGEAQNEQIIIPASEAAEASKPKNIIQTDVHVNVEEMEDQEATEEEFGVQDSTNLLFEPPAVATPSMPAKPVVTSTLTPEELMWKNSLLAMTTVISGKEFSTCQRRVLRNVSSGHRTANFFLANRDSHALYSNSITRSHPMSDESHPKHEYAALIVSSIICLDLHPRYSSTPSNASNIPTSTNSSGSVPSERGGVAGNVGQVGNEFEGFIDVSTPPSTHHHRWRLGKESKKSSVSYQYLIQPSAKSVILNAQIISQLPTFVLPVDILSSANEIFSHYETTANDEVENSSPKNKKSRPSLKLNLEKENSAERSSPKTKSSKPSSKQSKSSKSGEKNPRGGDKTPKKGDKMPRNLEKQNSASPSVEAPITRSYNRGSSAEDIFGHLHGYSGKEGGYSLDEIVPTSILPVLDPSNIQEYRLPQSPDPLAPDYGSSIGLGGQATAVGGQTSSTSGQSASSPPNPSMATSSVTTPNNVSNAVSHTMACQPTLSPYERCLQNYDPNFLDTDIVRPDKYKIPVYLPGYHSSLIPFIASKVVLQEENQAFREKHMWLTTDLTLSKIRSVKRKLEQTAISNGLDIACTALSYVYFEKLILRNLVHKHNARLFGAICLLLAAKYYGFKVSSFASLVKELESKLSVSAKEIIVSEFHVYKELKFSLFLEDEEVMPHFIKLKSSQATIDKEFLIKQKERKRRQKKAAAAAASASSSIATSGMNNNSGTNNNNPSNNTTGGRTSGKLSDRGGSNRQSIDRQSYEM